MTKTTETNVTGTAAAVVTALGEGPSSALALSQRMNVTHANARQVLRRLATAGVVTKVQRGLYALPGCDSQGDEGVAQERGEVAGRDRSCVGTDNAPATAADLGIRRDLAKLTTDALIDDVIGLRADLADAKAKVRVQKDEIADLKVKLSEATQEDLGHALGNAQRQRDVIGGRLAETMRNLKRMERRMKAVEAERDQMKARIENADAFRRKADTIEVGMPAVNSAVAEIWAHFEAMNDPNNPEDWA